jgi:hypothetical protein
MTSSKKTTVEDASASTAGYSPTTPISPKGGKGTIKEAAMIEGPAVSAEK